MAIVLTFFEQTVEIATEYLGPAADRFMRRQISTHLHKKPEDLEARDIAELVDWIRLAFALVTDDTSLTEAFSRELTALAEDTNTKGAGHGEE